ncbi:MAG: hypothetical protein PHC64_06260 [Candidatus Gastranaerophilales bacterium]|nr:hypothetical protein [Candidatus Gastranaerophilales bacterium]
MNKFRYDGSFVITLNGLPYHVVQEDALYSSTLEDFQTNPTNYEAEEIETMKYHEGNWVDISDTEEYLATITAKENALAIITIQNQIDELDKKRIRAIVEPSIKDEATGQTWLEYYTAQIMALRTEISA